MKLSQAVAIVLDLAKGNVIADDKDMRKEHNKQVRAIKLVENYHENEFQNGRYD